MPTYTGKRLAAMGLRRVAGARPETERLLAAKTVSRYRLLEALLPRRSCRIIRVELAE
jgi:hypothetical protein